MARQRFRGDAVFAPDSRPSQHAFDRYMEDEYERGVPRTGDPPMEPKNQTARTGAAQEAVPAAK